MSTGGLSVRALAADGMPSVAKQWIEMKLPTTTTNAELAASPATPVKPDTNAANSAVTVNSETNDFVRLVKDPFNLISVLGPARGGKSQYTSSCNIGQALTSDRYTLLCSKAVIYNRTGGLLTDDILKDLGMMTQAGQSLRNGQSSHANNLSDGGLDGRANGTSNTADVKPQSGHLFILFNRFQLNADTKSKRTKCVVLKRLLICP
jgi:hypothetical protein